MQEAEKRDFVKKTIDAIPEKLFPKLSGQSVKTCGIVGFSLSTFSLLLSFVPCLGSYGIFFSIPALYINFLATRRRTEKTSTLVLLGIIFGFLATLIALYWCFVVKAADDAFKGL